MPEGPVAKKPASPAGDPFAALPDAILQHILSFLPAQPAVRTCVLARRWRRLWEGMPGLRITAANAPEPPCAPDDLVSSGELREFVDHLLLLRSGAPLDSCEFLFDVREDADVPHVNLWIRHVIRCQVRRLKLTCLLEHSPVLEKLTIQIFSKGPEHKVEINGSYSPMEGSAAISENLRIIEVKCEVVDEGVLKVLDFLQTLNIGYLTMSICLALYISAFCDHICK
nr:unnamed protein product [Digitaria exilis]